MAGDALDAADLDHLRAAIAVSREAAARGDEPYGAVLVDASGRQLLAAGNTQNTTGDCTGHAETNLLREATMRFDAQALAGATLYASGEPCAMCAGAIYWSGVPRVVFALPAARMDAIAGEGTDVLDLGSREVLAHGRHEVIVVGPALEDEAAPVLEAHYGARRP
jgi:tRNA(Arg) A34 adenosine deaminase TadA